MNFINETKELDELDNLICNDTSWVNVLLNGVYNECLSRQMYVSEDLNKLSKVLQETKNKKIREEIRYRMSKLEQEYYECNLIIYSAYKLFEKEKK